MVPCVPNRSKLVRPGSRSSERLRKARRTNRCILAVCREPGREIPDLGSQG